MQDPQSIGATNTAGRFGSTRGHGGRGHGRVRGRGGGRSGGRGRNIYLGSYSPDQWHQLSAEDKKKVIDGWQQSAASASGSQNPNNRNLYSVAITEVSATTDHDAQTALTGATAQVLDQSILQGALQGSAAVGDKCHNTDSAGSFMTRRCINAIATSSRMSHVRNISQTLHAKHVQESNSGP